MTAARQLLLSEAIKTVLARHNLQDNIELEMELQGAINRALATAESPHSAAEVRKLTLNALAQGFAGSGSLQAEWNRLFKTSPNWDSRQNQKFVQWYAHVPALQTLQVFSDWWFGQHWLGKRGSPPTPAQVMEYWRLAMYPDERSYRQRSMPLPAGIEE